MWAFVCAAATKKLIALLEQGSWLHGSQRNGVCGSSPSSSASPSLTYGPPLHRLEPFAEACRGKLCASAYLTTSKSHRSLPSSDMELCSSITVPGEALVGIHQGRFPIAKANELRMADGTPRTYISIKWQQEDYESVISFARRASSPFDPTRVILFGSSFSGGTVSAVASRDHAVAAVMAQCPYVHTFKRRSKKRLISCITPGIRTRSSPLYA